MGEPRSGFLDDLQAATETAREEEERNKPLLRELLFSRAETEPEFRKALVANPERTVAELAKGIGVTASPDLVREVKEKYNAAIPFATDEQVHDLVFGTLEDVRKAFQDTLALSRWLFWFGLGVTTVSLIASLFPQQKGWIAGVFGSGGILTLLSYVVMNPLDRIRRAAANLVQVQMAYVSFYKQLNMLGAASPDGMKIEDAIKYSTELRTSAVETIAAVQRISEQAGSDASPAKMKRAGRGGVKKREPHGPEPANPDQ